MLEPYWQTSGYGPVRVRQGINPPTFLIRPIETQMEDLQEILTENHDTKRSHSPDQANASSSKSQKTDEEQSCLLAELASENELHRSNNPPQLQEKIDASKTVEWTTL